MRLHTARLCLDCEELHESPQCPVCASHAFSYVARWVPVLTQPRLRRVHPAALLYEDLVRAGRRGPNVS